MPKLITGFGSDKFMTDITDAQVDSYIRLVTQYKEIPATCYSGDGYLGCQFPDIFIGIEPDGYTHS